jgi:hypothetical protein
MAQWIRRWSTKPEILGSIPSGVVEQMNKRAHLGIMSPCRVFLLILYIKFLDGTNEQEGPSLSCKQERDYEPGKSKIGIQDP